MSDSNKNKLSESKGGGASEKLVLAMGAAAAILTAVAWMGLKKIKFKSFEFLILFFSFLYFALVITYADYIYLKWLHWLMPSYFTDFVVEVLRTIPKYLHFSFLIVLASYIVGVTFGITEYLKRKKLQKQLDGIGLSNANGEKPKVIREIELDENKSKLLITANGVGLERFEVKKSDLEASLGRIVDSISVTEDRRTVEVNMCKRELKKRISFYEACQHIKKPYHFLIGDSVGGILTADLRDLPHLLIAGSTGGGKSVFFRAVFVALLKYSRHLQVYLIDLKRGVEVREFAQVPNVRVAKDESEAVQMLQAIKEEMQRRFTFMEDKKIKKIDPEVHGKDLIVVGIDEASVLFGKTTVSKEKAHLVAEARELTDEIAKLSRAAGIHLVIATQKAVKESIDTKVLENLNGRMVFKMSTHAGSNTALGNVKAYSLPDIKGRGIWAGGNKFIEVQAPFLSEAELETECESITLEMKKSGAGNSQPMIEVEKVASKTEIATLSALVDSKYESASGS